MNILIINLCLNKQRVYLNESSALKIDGIKTNPPHCSDLKPGHI